MVDSEDFEFRWVNVILEIRENLRHPCHPRAKIAPHSGAWRQPKASILSARSSADLFPDQ
jgi:hypothetical protein